MFTKLRGGRVSFPSQNALTWPRTYNHCQRSPNHWLMEAGVLFTKLRKRKVNVRRSNRISGHREFT
ncbi:unnamed protein product [Schistosoma margrebowiei]|uniref:Uncharacterized protein n=1 Tax=Schistosoma margrebowiei TaxID=48269 RepID=A0A3P7YNY9_9TREM|nr:unnamed protein product [Schistosoma margrebowiei]